MSVRSIIGGGVRLIRTQPQVVSIWAALYLAVMVVGMVVMRPWLTTVMAFQEQAIANRAAGIVAPPAFPIGIFGHLMLFEVGLLLFLIIAFAAVVRAVTRPGGDRFAYLRLGMDELRLIGLGSILAIAAIVAEIVAIIVIAIVSVGFALVIGKAATAVIVAILVIALLCGAIYVEVRISLAGALTVMRGRIVIRDAWRATRGQFWTLFGAYALLLIGIGIVTIVIAALINPQLIGAYTSLDPRAITAAAQEQIARQSAGLSAGLIVQAVVSAIGGTVAGAILYGATATAALELGGAERADGDARMIP